MCGTRRPSLGFRVAFTSDFPVGLREDGPLFYDIEADEQDPFVMMAWRCKKLALLRVIGEANTFTGVCVLYRVPVMGITATCTWPISVLSTEVFVRWLYRSMAYISIKYGRICRGGYMGT